MTSLKFLACFILLLSLAAGAQGTVIGFDDLPAVSCSGTPLPPSYAGFNWNGWGYDNATVAPCSTSGYGTALTSPPNIGFNLGGGIPGAIATITSNSPFTLLSGDFAAAWNDGLTITVTGKFFGIPVGTLNFTVNTATKTLETFDFGSVTELDFSSAGGVPNPNLSGSGGNFGVDNLTIVPEPSTLSLFSIPLWLILATLRAKKNRHLRNK
jgi:hypothetical protein